MAEIHKANSREALGVRIDALIDEMRAQCDRLDRLSIEQGISLRTGEVEEVLAVLVRREPVVQCLTDLGEQIEAILGDEQSIEMLGEAGASGVHRRLEELEQIAGGIRRRDAEHHELMKHHRDSLAQRLSSVGQKKTAVDAYSGISGTPNPTLQDRRG